MLCRTLSVQVEWSIRESLLDATSRSPSEMALSGGDLCSVVDYDRLMMIMNVLMLFFIDEPKRRR